MCYVYTTKFPRINEIAYKIHNGSKSQQMRNLTKIRLKSAKIEETYKYLHM
jgi:hypothetical protein